MGFFKEDSIIEDDSLSQDSEIEQNQSEIHIDQLVFQFVETPLSQSLRENRGD